MVNVNIDISEELLDIAKKQEININQAVKHLLWEEVLWNEAFEKIASKSKLTEKDVQEIGDKIKQGIAKRHGL